jgi:hypothetical protein
MSAFDVDPDADWRGISARSFRLVRSDHEHHSVEEALWPEGRCAEAPFRVNFIGSSFAVC